MRVVFAGTPVFARAALEALYSQGFQVPLVLTQPDRPAGRGMKAQPSPVKAWALEHSVVVAQPRSLRLDGRHPGDAQEARSALKAVSPDVMVVAAYGLILPRWVLDLPRLGCLNIHASLLPRWRGAAPIHRAIEAGDAQTGVTIMQMDEGLDTGDMLLWESMPIPPDATTGSLHEVLAALGGRLIVQALRQLAVGGLTAMPQPAQGVSYARKIDKAEAAIDWRDSASVIERRIRAFDPAPGATASLGGLPVKCWAARLAPGQGEPGTLLSVDAQGVRVACGSGALDLTHLQRPGGRRLPAREFLAGQGAAAWVGGRRLDLPDA